MTEEPFEVPIGDGVLVGHRGGEGSPALVLHGGPAMSDYTQGLAAELAHLFTTYRYTQRGAAPSTVGPPYSIESHSQDAIAVLDGLGIERAWAVGHSWGGHLALHLAIAHPDRLLGVVAIDPLAAHQIFSEAGENLRRRLTPKQRARVDEVEEMRRAGTATDVDLRERWTILWPQYFADPTAAAPPAGYSIGVDCSRDTNASILEHFERGTLLAGLASVELPVLFVHGARDPMPLWSVEQTAAIVPGAELVVIPGCGHFPWWEAPGEIERAVAAFLAARG